MRNMRRVFRSTAVSIAIFLLVSITFGSFTWGDQKKDFPILKGPYLGQTPPGPEPRLFAPGIVSTGMMTRDIAMMPDGSEIYFSVMIGKFSLSSILVSKIENGQWTKPEVASFASDPQIKTLEPCITPDGKKFFFASNRPSTPGGPIPEELDIWTMDRTGNGWSEPKPLNPSVNTPNGEYFPSVTQDGTLYFCRQTPDKIDTIYRSRFVNGKYSEPEKLPAQVNCGATRFNAFIAPDESYLIVCVVGKEGNLSPCDYYIVFRNPDDTWREPINIGKQVNIPQDIGYSPYVSRDGKYFFYMSTKFGKNFFAPGEKLSYQKLSEIYNQPESGNSAIYWIDAKFIEELKNKK